MTDRDHAPARRDLIKTAGFGIGLGAGLWVGLRVGLGIGLGIGLGVGGLGRFAKNRQGLPRVTRGFLALPAAAAP
ncbi:MAG TPA: hypothetical protein VE909_10375 [Xanthobacteraceae bacterium]|nr:hypothetical protein [Xanthobacteraceae bacterium]